MPSSTALRPGQEPHSRGKKPRLPQEPSLPNRQDRGGPGRLSRGRWTGSLPWEKAAARVSSRPFGTALRLPPPPPPAHALRVLSAPHIHLRQAPSAATSASTRAGSLKRLSCVSRTRAGSPPLSARNRSRSSTMVSANWLADSHRRERPDHCRWEWEAHPRLRQAKGDREATRQDVRMRNAGATEKRYCACVWTCPLIESLAAPPNGDLYDRSWSLWSVRSLLWVVSADRWADSGWEEQLPTCDILCC